MQRRAFFSSFLGKTAAASVATAAIASAKSEPQEHRVRLEIPGNPGCLGDYQVPMHAVTLEPGKKNIVLFNVEKISTDSIESLCREDDGANWPDTTFVPYIDR